MDIETDSNSNNSSVNKLKRSSEISNHEGEKRVRMNIKSNTITHTTQINLHLIFNCCVVCFTSS